MRILMKNKRVGWLVGFKVYQDMLGYFMQCPFNNCVFQLNTV